MPDSSLQPAPKSKVRREDKYEVRSPKSEVKQADTVARRDDDSAFWMWCKDEAGSMELHDGGSVPDLLERSARFGEAVVRFCKKVPRGPVTDRLVGQLVGAGASVGANYCEASDAVSRNDFMNRVGTSRKESKEAMLFLRLIAAAEESLAPEARLLWREAKELNLIFGSIWRKK